MKKRVLSLLLALCLVMGALPLSALATEAPDAPKAPVTDTVNTPPVTPEGENQNQTPPADGEETPAKEETPSDEEQDSDEEKTSDQEETPADAEEGISLLTMDGEAVPLAEEETACLTVRENAPTEGSAKTGSLYQLKLADVFQDAEGHGLSYSYTCSVSNEKIQIKDGVFYFSVPNTGSYDVTLTATCAEGTSVSHQLTIAVETAPEGIDAQYNYNETSASAVKVYVTLSNDGMPLLGEDDTVLSHLEVTVPYFDLGSYGLGAYYRCGTDGGKGPYTNENLIQRPTGLHLYIYLLERYYMGLSEDQCGKGDSGVLNYSFNTTVRYMDSKTAYDSGKTGALTLSGSATSLYMKSFWGHDENLMYFRNHCYPYMSPGWGATSDYILLSDGDTWDVAMFTDWTFHDSGYFAKFDQDAYIVEGGESLTVSTQKWDTTSDAAGFSDASGLTVGLYDSNWEMVQTLSYTTGNSLTFTAPTVAGEYYLLAMDPNARKDGAKIAPATAQVTVTSADTGAVTGVTVEPETMSLTVGATGQLAATVQPAQATGWTLKWTSSNEEVATVDQTGKVTAVAPGEAVITAAVGDVTATCTVTTQQEKPANYLSALGIYSTYSSTDADIFPMTPAFDPAVKEYTVVIPDNYSSSYAKATLAEGVTGTITAAWTNLNTDEAKTATITSGKSNGQTLAGAVKTGNYKNTVTFTVAGEGVEDVYTLNIVRTPTLTGLDLEGMKLSPTFTFATTAYTATTAADSVTVAATPRDESYTVTVNGTDSNEVALEMGENDINVVVKNAEGYEMAYTITVTRKEAITVSFETNVENPNIVMKDANKIQVIPVDGVYTLITGETYSYTIQKDGYVGQMNSFTLTESGVIEITMDQATENPNLNKNIYAQWGNFRKGDNNLGITDAPTPYAPEDAELLWAVKYGTGWAAAPGSPIMVDGDIITYIGTSIKRLDRMTGEVKAEGTMVAKSSFSIVPATYADGMIFVGLAGGKIQAFNAATLESLWVYTDDLGGQPNCPITYKDGYVYAGFWNNETKDAHFACVSTIDEDHSSTTEAKLASWTYTRTGGFYWAGAYVTDKLAIVGTDDGQSGSTSDSSSLLVFDRFTGELLDHHDGIHGDIRSNVSHDPDSDRVFFTSKGGVLCNAKVDWDTGKITDFHQVVLQDANGTEYAMSTCTPSVYNGRIYIGVCGASQFGDNSGHAIAVYDLNADGSMTRAYAYAIIGYPQTSAMVTTAYADEEDGSVYIYLPYNAQPGGVSVLKDKKGQTAPITTTDEGYSEIFTPVSPLNQYCICSTIADEYGTIYYKNDSCYMMAITSKIESLELESEPTFTVKEDGTYEVSGLKAVTHQKNGTTRDVTNYATVDYNAETGAYSVSYTYGLDHANYGLKTLTLYSVSIPEGQGYTVTGKSTADAGEDYTFTVTGSGEYVVKVNGEEVKPNESGVYTVANVAESLVITVSVIGDLNGDDNVTMEDVLLLLQAINGTGEGCDLNGDDNVTMDDVLLLLPRINGTTEA